MPTACSHVLIWVRDLHRAVRDYRELGFAVDYATAEAKAQHAHVWFTSGPVLELLTTPRSAKLFEWPINLIAGRGAGRRMTRWSERGEGFCDVAVATNGRSLREEVVDLRRQGVPIGRPIHWQRTRPDGQHIEFGFAYPHHERLPFLVSPYDPPQHPREVRHANGATRLEHVGMGVRADDEPALRQIIGADPTFVLERADTTAVHWVELAGLQVELDPARLHGAALRRAG